MVKVKVTSQQNLISEIHVKDHAGSGVAGQDLVCAGVSSICFGALNALNELCENAFDYEIKEANVKIIVKDAQCETAQIILKTIYIQLLTMAESYGKFIKLTKVEV